MAQVLVIEPEEIVVSALKKTFENDDELKLTFVNNFLIGTEILNGNPKNKSIYEKHKLTYEQAKEEFQELTKKELSAKNTAANASDILEKFKNELKLLSEPIKTEVISDASSAGAKAEDVKTTDELEIQHTATPEENEIKKQSLQKEISRLEIELKVNNEELAKASKLKNENEKIVLEKQKLADEAKAKLPNAAEEVFSVLMISAKLIVPNAVEWSENFKKLITFESNKDIKIIVLGFEFDEKSVKKFLTSRISDYMVKPIDELLARQNIKFLALTDKKPKREVYSLKIEESIDLVFELELEGLSESSFFIKSQEGFSTNEFKIFSSDLFLRKDQRSVLAKCLSSTKIAEGHYSSEFWIMGMDVHLAFQIKNAIKKCS